MIPLSPTLIGAAGAALLVVGLGVALKVQNARLDACKADHAAFVAKVQAIGEAQETKARAADAASKKAKEQADVELARKKRDLDSVYLAYRSLRDQPRTNSGVVPVPAPGASDPDRICLSRSALDRGMGDADNYLQENAARILRRGDEAIEGLNALKSWATSR